MVNTLLSLVGLLVSVSPLSLSSASPSLPELPPEVVSSVIDSLIVCVFPLVSVFCDGSWFAVPFE